MTAVRDVLEGGWFRRDDAKQRIAETRWCFNGLVSDVDCQRFLLALSRYACDAPWTYWDSGVVAEALRLLEEHAAAEHPISSASCIASRFSSAVYRRWVRVPVAIADLLRDGTTGTKVSWSSGPSTYGQLCDKCTKAIEDALRFGLTDLHRLERMILRRIAGDFFQLPLDPKEPQKEHCVESTSPCSAFRLPRATCPTTSFCTAARR